LKELIVEKINEKRVRRGFKTLTTNTSLQITADNYTKALRAKKLERNLENKARINKKFKKNCRTNGYTNAFIDYHITSIPCIHLSGTKFYYDKEDTETPVHLFLGEKPTKKEKEKDGFKAYPAKLYSYQELANAIARQFISDEGSFKILNNGFDKFGFSLAVEQQTLFKNKLPKIKAIIIVGGNRITW
jgi:hypothetical protein